MFELAQLKSETTQGAIGVYVKIILSYAPKKVDEDFVDWRQLSIQSTASCKRENAYLSSVKSRIFVA